MHLKHGDRDERKRNRPLCRLNGDDPALGDRETLRRRFILALEHFDEELDARRPTVLTNDAHAHAVTGRHQRLLAAWMRKAQPHLVDAKRLAWTRQQGSLVQSAHEQRRRAGSDIYDHIVESDLPRRKRQSALRFPFTHLQHWGHHPGFRI